MTSADAFKLLSLQGRALVWRIAVETIGRLRPGSADAIHAADEAERADAAVEAFELRFRDAR